MKQVGNISRKLQVHKTTFCVSRSFSTSLTGCNCGKTNCECMFIKTTPGSPYYQPRKSSSSTSLKNPFNLPRSSFSSVIDSGDNNNPIDILLKNNKEWLRGLNEKDPNYIKSVGDVHKPKYLYFGCSDARVAANLLLGLGPGEVFVHRNIGNLVPVNDLNALSVLEYAVGHLGVTDIIVTV